MSILLSLPLYYFAFVPIELVQLNYRNNRHFVAISGAEVEKTQCKDIQYLRNFTSHQPETKNGNLAITRQARSWS